MVCLVILIFVDNAQTETEKDRTEERQEDRFLPGSGGLMMMNECCHPMVERSKQH